MKSDKTPCWGTFVSSQAANQLRGGKPLSHRLKRREIEGGIGRGGPVTVMLKGYGATGLWAVGSEAERAEELGAWAEGKGLGE
ncbi:hypothetical protein M0804_008929 [Polistes exclamans]|nr:hypothetical protein M0804_008929 [Polistes exclamans]